MVNACVYIYLMRRSFVASTDVVYPVVLLGLDWGSRLGNAGGVGSTIHVELLGGEGGMDYTG
jgi:prolipoprotein diacylglyceryltransferase